MTAPGDGDEERRRRRAAAIVFGVLVVAVVAVFALGGDARPEVAGEQYPSPTARVQAAGSRQWTELAPADGRRRLGFPVPMIASGDQVCFGFGRVDFDPPRPTLARCIEADDIPELPAEGLQSLVVVRAGADTWHLLATAGELSTVVLVAEDGASDEGRVHLSGEFAALRIDTSATITALEWIIGRTRFVCQPPADAADTGRFCPPAS